MRQVPLLLVGVLMLSVEPAAAQCEREWAELLTRLTAKPGTKMDILDGEIRWEASKEALNFWAQHGPIPADEAAALRIRAKYWDLDRPTWERSGSSGSWVKAESPYKACRARYLANQLDAPRLAKEQQLREQTERDRLARDRAARDAVERDRLAREREARRQQLERGRLDRALKEQERQDRIKRALEEEAQRQREEDARLAAEEAAERARYQRELKAHNDRLRAEQEEEKRREELRKPFEARNVSECVSVMKPLESIHGGFRNSCDFDIWVAYCHYRPKEGEFSSGFDCDKDLGGLDRIAARGFQGAHTKNSERVFWFACNAPSTPKVTYQPATGLFGTCR